MKLYYIIEICVAIDIAIFGIAYPIIVNKVSNIGEKYNSNYLSELFNNEFPLKKINIKLNIYFIFKFTLYFTIFSFLFLVFSFPPLFKTNIEILDWFIGNSAELLILVLTMILIIFFIMLLEKIVIYDGKATTLLKRVIKNYKEFENKEDILKKYHLKTINELAFYALDKSDKHLEKTLLKFYFEEFYKIRREHDKSKTLEYPNELYEFIYDLISIVVKQEQRKLPALEHRAISGIWLLGEDFDEIEISNETYKRLWSNLVLICENEKFIKDYWSTANQHIRFKIKKISPIINDKGETKNESEVKKREEERKRFLEFHYALGGLLMYKNQYKSIKNILQFSDSVPPIYPLLPKTMTKIFQIFEDFSNEFKRITPLDLRYPFPDLDNLGISGQTIIWVGNYIALLFIREFSRIENYTYQNFTAQSQLPKDILELNNWHVRLPFFDKCLENVLSNKKLLQETNYLDIAESKKSDFFKFTAELRKNIINQIREKKLKAPLSNEKISKFNNRTKEIINDTFKEYRDVFIPLDKNRERSELKLILNGISGLFDKFAFTDNDVAFLGYDTYFADIIANDKIKKSIPNIFLNSSTRRYLLSIDNIIDGIKKLQINKKDFVIVGVRLDDDLEKKLCNDKQNLIKIPSTGNFIENTLFILERENLPSIIHNDLKEKEIKKYELKLIDKKIKLYTSVIEQKDSKSKEKLKDITNPNDIDLKVMVTIAFSSFIVLKKGVEIVQLNIESQFKEQGIPNNISEIIPFGKNTGKF